MPIHELELLWQWSRFFVSLSQSSTPSYFRKQRWKLLFLRISANMLSPGQSVSTVSIRDYTNMKNLFILCTRSSTDRLRLITNRMVLAILDWQFVKRVDFKTALRHQSAMGSAHWARFKVQNNHQIKLIFKQRMRVSWGIKAEDRQADPCRPTQHRRTTRTCSTAVSAYSRTFWALGVESFQLVSTTSWSISEAEIVATRQNHHL